MLLDLYTPAAAAVTTTLKNVYTNMLPQAMLHIIQKTCLSQKQYKIGTFMYLHLRNEKSQAKRKKTYRTKTTLI